MSTVMPDTLESALAEITALRLRNATLTYQVEQAARIAAMMERLSEAPQIGIINDCDAPDARMLVVVWIHNDIPVFKYISAGQWIGEGRRTRRQPFQGDRFTVLGDFGIRANVTGQTLTVSRSGAKSTATYPDGVPRQWQGKPQPFQITIRPTLVAVVTWAVKAASAPRSCAANQPHTEPVIPWSLTLPDRESV